MPDNNNRGNRYNDDFDAYLELLDNQSGKKRTVSRDFSNLMDELNHEEAVYGKKHLKEEEDFPSSGRLRSREQLEQEYLQIRRQEIQQRNAAQKNASSNRPENKQRRASAKGNKEKNPTPPKMKKNGKYVTVDEIRKNSKNPVVRWFYNLSKKKQKLVKAFSVILVILIVSGTALGIFINNKFNMMGDLEEYTDNVVYEEEEFKDIDGDINSSNFKEALQKWATTGNDEKMKSKNVVNVLLIGADSRSGTNTGNTDVMMLVSLNKKTKQIKLVSFMRDSYLYIEGKNSSYCAKLNAAFSMGGPETLMNTIENNYKIEIDNFVMVNFESFKSIIDKMGGITVDVQKYEANYSNTKYDLSMPYGEDVTLTGEEALIFCRIRGCDADGDVSRTRRQRQVINAIMDRVKNASITDLNTYLNALLPYIYTGFSKSQILSLGMKAISNGWATYSRSELQIPTPETRTSGSMGGWIWVIDYQLAAQTLQNELYGQTNITLEEGRTTLIDVYRGTSGSGSASGGGSSTPVKDVEVEESEHTTAPKEDVKEEVTEEIFITEPETTEATTRAPETEAEVTEATTAPETTVAETEPVEEETEDEETMIFETLPEDMYEMDEEIE
ncbi:MAG: LCP family protein [Clostridia bacterium]|nr:LCP family protein [Clostridia bacterium]